MNGEAIGKSASPCRQKGGLTVMGAYVTVVLGVAVALLAVLTVRAVRRQQRLFSLPLQPGPLSGRLAGGASFITTRGLLAALAGLLQLSAAYLPGAGHFLSAFAALPISVAAEAGPLGGLWTYAAAAGVILAGQAAELPAFAFITGPLGLVIGWSAATGNSRGLAWLIAAAVVFSGMALLTWVTGVPALGGISAGASPAWVIALFAMFAGAYSWAWLLLTEEIFRRLERVATAAPGADGR